MPENSPAVPAPTVPTPAPGDRPDNPFRALALLLEAVRVSLEASKAPNKAPRWVRIVRVRDFKEDTIASVVTTMAGGLVTALGYMQRFALDATDLLIQGDAAKALVEVSAEFVKKATSKEFINALELAIGQEPSADSPIGSVAGVVDQIVKIADKVPEPEDLEVIGRELYKLLAIDLKPADDAVDATTTDHIEIDTTGKLRLLQWGLGTTFKVQNFGKGATPSEAVLTALGSRRVWQADNASLPQRSLGKWGDEANQETVFELLFNGDKAGVDIAEANTILDGLGYPVPTGLDRKVFSDKFTERLKSFQTINGLEANGKLDKATLNRLLHLDTETQSLKRAKRYKADPEAAPSPAAGKKK
ncbi:peptidoglycan-binding domain-containing protein [Chitiniphilus eburneus]|uniref:Peptidoglycan-binding protein n=1 Tax=Chitiniphilus eburneus TaxID=2571148 RepID=A0A4U0P9W9_9NEIS|nr:peptidoglycan-binding domain-containing protein [Chitiniphilus eburneus]TJZ64259.1 peptidoglycan-binding protein [Chitiniphilus eburneus]